MMHSHMGHTCFMVTFLNRGHVYWSSLEALTLVNNEVLSWYTSLQIHVCGLQHHSPKVSLRHVGMLLAQYPTLLSNITMHRYLGALL